MFSDFGRGKNASSVTALWWHCVGDYASCNAGRGYVGATGCGSRIRDEFTLVMFTLYGIFAKSLVDPRDYDRDKSKAVRHFPYTHSYYYEHRINDVTRSVCITIKYQSLYSILAYIIIFTFEIISNEFRCIKM